MFDLTSSKLLILAVVALIVVGPKDFPLLLRTIGRYLGILKRHADDFRAQFDAAIRESELHEMKAQVEKMSREIEETVREADRTTAAALGEAKSAVDGAIAQPPTPSPALAAPETAQATGAHTTSTAATGADVAELEPPAPLKKSGS